MYIVDAELVLADADLKHVTHARGKCDGGEA